MGLACYPWRWPLLSLTGCISSGARRLQTKCEGWDFPSRHDIYTLVHECLLAYYSLYPEGVRKIYSDPANLSLPCISLIVDVSLRDIPKLWSGEYADFPKIADLKTGLSLYAYTV